jgi:hypothetical protein
MVIKYLLSTKFITTPIVNKIFDLFVDAFMKLKQESRGIPKHCLDADGVVNSKKTTRVY